MIGRRRRLRLRRKNCLNAKVRYAGYALSYARPTYEFKLGESRISEADGELVRKIYSLLPKRNCGACGYPSCYDLAVAIASGKERSDACRIVGKQIAKEIDRILKKK